MTRVAAWIAQAGAMLLVACVLEATIWPDGSAPIEAYIAMGALAGGLSFFVAAHPFFGGRDGT